MKKLVSTAVAAMVITFSAFAADLNMIDDQSIQVFIKLFPRYRMLADKYRDEISDEGGLKGTSNYKREVDALFRKYKVDADQFALMVRKMTYAFSAVKMKENGIPSAWLEDPSLASQAEMASIERHMPELEKVLE
jgi:hypothetical protein